MLFIDYNFYVSQDIIIFDRELDPKSVFEDRVTIILSALS